MSSSLVYRIIWVPSLIALIVMVVLFGSQPYKMPPPTAMKTFVTGDKTIVVSHPGNWEGHDASVHDVMTKVHFDPTQNVHLVIVTDLQNSLMADMNRASNNAMSSLSDSMGQQPGGGQEPPPPPMKTPLERAHEDQAARLGKSYVEFQDGPTTQTQVSNVDALISDFTFQGKGLFGSQEMAGKRVSALAGDRYLSVVFTCPKESMAELAPTFTKILESLQVRPAGG